MKKQLAILVIFLFPIIASAINWKTVTLSDENLQDMHIFDDQTAILIGYNKFIKRTEDGGKTWQEVTLPTLPISTLGYDFTAMCFEGKNGYLIARNTDDDNGNYHDGIILKSIDKGINWEVIPFNNFNNSSTDPAENMTLDACWKRNPNAIYCLNADTSFCFVKWTDSINDDAYHSYVYKTLDGGSSWTKAFDKDFEGSYIKCFQFEKNIGYMGGSQKLYQTTDYGNTWTDYCTIPINDYGDAYIQSILNSSFSDRTFFISNGDGVFYSDDNLSSTNLLFNTGGNDMLELSSNNLIICGSSSKNHYSTDAGASWSNLNPPGSIFEIGGVMNDSIYCLGRGKLYIVAVNDLFGNSSDIKDTNTEETDLIIKNIDNGYLDIQSSKEIEYLNVYSINGQILQNQTINSTFAELNQPLSTGCYIISVMYSDGQTENKKTMVY